MTAPDSTAEDRDCQHCGQAIERAPAVWRVATGTVRAVDGDWTDRSEWFHVGGGHRCPEGTPGLCPLAQPVPRCPECHSTNITFDASDPWADYTRCGDCPYVYRRSLGD